MSSTSLDTWSQSSHGPFPPRRRGTVVIVDDNVAILDVYRNILSHEGYAVKTATSFDSLVASFEQPEGPALLVLDSFMPGQSGEEVLDALWERFPAVMASLPTVGMSSALRGMPLVDRFASRVTEFVVKPHHVDGLVAIVEKYVLRPAE